MSKGTSGVQTMGDVAGAVWAWARRGGRRGVGPSCFLILWPRNYGGNKKLNKEKKQQQERPATHTRSTSFTNHHGYRWVASGGGTTAAFVALQFFRCSFVYVNDKQCLVRLTPVYCSRCPCSRNESSPCSWYAPTLFFLYILHTCIGVACLC